MNVQPSLVICNNGSQNFLLNQNIYKLMVSKGYHKSERTTTDLLVKRSMKASSRLVSQCTSIVRILSGSNLVLAAEGVEPTASVAFQIDLILSVMSRVGHKNNTATNN